MDTERTSNPLTPRYTLYAWGAGVSLALIVILINAFCFDMHYANNDDTLILRQTMGFFSAELPTFNLFVGFLLMYPLRWLTAAFPGVAWFSWMQLFLLAFAMAGCVKSILCAGKNQPMWMRIVGLLLFTLVYAAPIACRVTFTTTAAMLGAAAVLQILSIDVPNEDGDGWRIFPPMMLALVYAALAYSLRSDALLPTLGFCAIAVAALYLRAFRGRKLKPLIAACLAVLLVLCGLWGLRAMEMNADANREYVQWQEQNGRVFDYYQAADIDPALLEAAGWSPELSTLLNDWYFMDSAMTTEATRQLADALDNLQDSSLSARLGRAWATLAAFFEKEPINSLLIWITLSAVLCCLACGLFSRKRLNILLPLGGGIALTAVMLLYLSAKGRLPIRAVMMVLLPMAALTAGLLAQTRHTQWSDGEKADCKSAECKPAEGKSGLCRMIPLALALCCLCLSAFYLVPTVQSQLKAPIDENADNLNAYQDLDEFGVDNADYLLICDGSLIGDLRMFPSTAYGIPHNILFWGGWGAHSPEYDRQLRAYGFEPDSWMAESFLSDDVRLMRGMIDPAPFRLLNYIAAETGAEVDAYLDSEWGGVYSFDIEGI